VKRADFSPGTGTSVRPKVFIKTNETTWFDPENCAFCKTLTEDPSTLKNMKGELHDISNGLAMITTVKPESLASYRKAREEMDKLGQEIMDGKTGVQVCNHCESYGNLVMTGAKFDNMKTETGEVTIISSEKPELLDSIREFGRRTREAMASWK